MDRRQTDKIKQQKIVEQHEKTRKLCYRKDDRAMRPIHGALKIFGTP